MLRSKCDAVYCVGVVFAFKKALFSLKVVSGFYGSAATFRDVNEGLLGAGVDWHGNSFEKLNLASGAMPRICGCRER